MNILWEKTTLADLTLPSRLVCSAAGEGMCDEVFHATPRLIQRYYELGKDGAIGLIITGHAFVSPEGRRRVAQISLASDSAIPALSEVAKAAKHGGSQIFIQMSHGGLCSEEALTGLPAIGPSDADNAPEYSGRAMTVEEIHAMVEHFADAARRAQLAGFDGIELHMAHGFLLSEFLSPLFNHRTDEYGGTQEKRTRFAVEIIHAIHALCGSQFPIIAKVNYQDGQPGGLTIDMALESAKIMESAGLAGIEISGGLCFRKNAAETPMKPVSLAQNKGLCYFRDAARRFKNELRIPVIIVGGIRTVDTIEEILANGEADLVGICRPFIRDPALARKWRAGDSRPSDCLSCNRCLEYSRTSMGLQCPIKK